MNRVLFKLYVIVLILLFISLVNSQSNIFISGGITNNGPVNAGESINFYGNCQGANTALIICKENEICNLNPQSIICKSEFSDINQKSCSYQTTDLDVGINDNDVGTCCNGDNQCDTNTVLIEKWVVKKIIEKAEPVNENDFSNFPNFLRIRKEGNTIIPMNTTIIVGSNAPSEDAISTVELIDGIGIGLSERIFSSLDSDVDRDILNKDNLIIIGNSSVNNYLKEFSSEESNLPYYISKIKLADKEKNKIIYILGKDSFYRRKAALILANYKEYNLIGSEICVSGSNLDINQIDIVDCNNLQNIQDPTLSIQYSIEQQIQQIEKEYISGVLESKEILLNNAECYDYERLNFDCTELIKNKDENYVSLITSKNQDSYAEVNFDFNNSQDGILLLKIVFESGDKNYQTIPIYYHDGELLKNICIITPNNEKIFEEQYCEIKNFVGNNLKIRLEGVSFRGDISLRIDSVSLNYTYAKESLIAKTYSKILRNIQGSLQPNREEEIILSGECGGENTKLIICNYGQACSLNFTENIICQSEFSSETLKQCTYYTNQNNLDISDTFVGTCCNIDGLCDTTTAPLNRYDLKPAGKNKTIYKTAKGKYYFMNFTNIYPGINSFSVGAWIKFDYAHDGVILSTGEEEPVERYWGVSINFAGENQSLVSVKLNSGQGEIIGYNKKNLLDGKWHYIVFVRDKFVNLVRIYVDGVFESEFYDFTDDISDISNSLRVGYGNIELNDWFVGNISDISIFNSILSEAEINASYTENY